MHVDIVGQHFHISFPISSGYPYKIMSLDVKDKLLIAKEKKEHADQAFKTGDLKDGEY